MTRVTKAKAQEIFDKWKAMFGLSNWQCKIYVVTDKDLKKKFKTVPLKIGDAGIDFDTLAEHADIFISRKCSLDKLEFSIKHEMGHLVCSSADMLIAYIIKEYGLNKECEAQWAVELEKIINKWINIIDRAIE